jgi:GT2 family glycosyltransferase
MKKINKSLIIPFYDCFDLVVQRLAELSSFGIPNDMEVILVNDGSEDIKTLMMLEKARITFPFFVSVGFEENKGFSAANNLGASAAIGDILYFLSSDVKIRGPFWNVSDEPSYMDTIYGGRYLNYDTGWNKFKGTLIPYLEGWFIECATLAFNTLGKWDTRFDPHDYEDIDLSLRAQIAGFKLQAIPDSYLVHMGCGTIGRKKSALDRMVITERNRKYFETKWDNILRGAAHA